MYSTVYISFSDLETHTDWKWSIPYNRNQNKAGVAILTSDKIDFKVDYYKRQGHYIMINGSIQEDISTLNIYVCTQHKSTSIYKAKVNR